MLSLALEKRLRDENREILLNKALKKDQSLQQTELQRANITARSNEKRFLRHVHMQRQELQRLKEIEEEAQRKADLEKPNAEEQLKQQKADAKRCHLRDIKLRQQLRENEPELRDLERKLRQAYVAKELACQIAQKEADRLEQRIRQKQADEGYYNSLRLKSELNDVDLELAEMRKQAEYRTALEEQMLQKQLAVKAEYEQFLKEKKVLDEIAQRLHDEDTKILLLKMEKLKKTQEEIKAFEAAREEWRKREIQRIQEENERIEKYVHQQMTIKAKRDDESRKLMEAKERMADKLGQEIYEKANQLRERENLLSELKDIEAREAADERHRTELEKKFRERLQISKTLEQQIQAKEEAIRREKEEDVKYREDLLQRMIEAEKLEQLSDQKRRMKMQECRRAAEQIMAEREHKRVEEIKNLWKAKEIAAEDERERREMVEVERVRLLEEHLKNVVGYIPSGILRPGDLERLGIEKLH